MNNNWKTTILWLICCILLAQVDVVAFSNYQQSDSIPQIEKKIYRGFRIHLTQIKIQQRKGNQIKIKYTAINTGREPVSLGTPVSTPEHLIILFDGSLAEQNLTDYADQIRQQLTQSSLRLEPGFIRSDLSLSFSTNGTPKSGSNDLALKGGQSKETPQVKDNSEKQNTDATEMDLNACADLSIQDVKIKSKGRKNITLEVTLVNLGAGPARIYRDKDRKKPQVALRGNFSSTEKLSRGDVVIGGDYIETKNKNPHGWLKPMESFTTTVKFDMRKKSKFTPYLILELDAYNGLAECDETNNLGVVKVEE